MAAKRPKFFADAQEFRTTHWVISAKRPETRERRLAQLIEHAAAGRRVPHFTRPDRKKP